MARDVQRLLPMKDPILVTSWNFIPRMPALDPWMLNTDNPRWGNNAEATSSFGVRMLRLQLIRNSNPREEVGKELVVYNLEFAQRQIIENLHPSDQNSNVHASGLQTQVIKEVPLSSNPMDSGFFNDFESKDINMLEADDSIVQEDERSEIRPDTTPGSTRKKRKAKEKTPMVDDEVRRSARFKKADGLKPIQLDNEPRRKKGAAFKTVSISTVEDLKTAIINRTLDSDLEIEDVEPIQAITLVDFGTSFCGIPSLELADPGLTQSLEE
jgi:hypothetical protein